MSGNRDITLLLAWPDCSERPVKVRLTISEASLGFDSASPAQLIAAAASLMRRNAHDRVRILDVAVGGSVDAEALQRDYEHVCHQLQRVETIKSKKGSELYELQEQVSYRDHGFRQAT